MKIGDEEEKKGKKETNMILERVEREKKDGRKEEYKEKTSQNENIKGETIKHS